VPRACSTARDVLIGTQFCPALSTLIRQLQACTRPLWDKQVEYCRHFYSPPTALTSTAELLFIAGKSRRSSHYYYAQ
jgi:hypothetical protein